MNAVVNIILTPTPLPSRERGFWLTSPLMGEVAAQRRVKVMRRFES